MALRWFIRAASTQIVGQPEHGEEGCERIKVESFKMANHQAKDTSSNWECSQFRMPLHYPRYKKEDYMKMEEWKVDMLMREYGLVYHGSLEEKRAFAMGTFLWPNQL